jgi:hypothetical protein
MDKIDDIEILLSILKNEEELIIKPFHSGEILFKNIKIFISILSKV